MFEAQDVGGIDRIRSNLASISGHAIVTRANESIERAPSTGRCAGRGKKVKSVWTRIPYVSEEQVGLL